MTPFWRDHRVPLMQRLHSAAGVVPLGAFFALHLWINARALQGRRAYETWVYTLQALPGRAVLEIVFIGLPLAFHAFYGAVIVAGRAPGAAEPEFTHPWSRSMQRVTGVAVLVFVVFHLTALRIPVASGELIGSDLFPHLADTLSATTSLGVPAAATAYLLGLAATSYHLANGLSRFCLRLGLGENPRTRRAVSIGCTFLGSALFFLGTNTVVYFATGSSLVG